MEAYAKYTTAIASCCFPDVFKVLVLWNISKITDAVIRFFTVYMVNLTIRPLPIVAYKRNLMGVQFAFLECYCDVPVFILVSKNCVTVLLSCDDSGKWVVKKESANLLRRRFSHDGLQMVSCKTATSTPIVVAARNESWRTCDPAEAVSRRPCGPPVRAAKKWTHLDVKKPHDLRWLRLSAAGSIGTPIPARIVAQWGG